jgi:environmental stress-induced protein Ves
MMLNGHDGSHHPLTIPFQPWSMRGDDAIRARLLNGSARDFNVMVRRGNVQATVQVWQTQQTLAPHTSDAVFFCARGVFRISVPGCEDVRLAAGLALRMTDFAAGLSAEPENPDSILIGTLLNFTK